MTNQNLYCDRDFYSLGDLSKIDQLECRLIDNFSIN